MTTFTLRIPEPRNAQQAAFQARIMARAMELFSTGGYGYERVTGLRAGDYYRVFTPQGKTYIVDPLLNCCTCPAFEQNGYCKHAIAIAEVLLDIERADAWEAQQTAADKDAEDDEADLTAAPDQADLDEEAHIQAMYEAWQDGQEWEAEMRALHGDRQERYAWNR